MKRRSPSAGFTLIELLIVVVVIGILAAIAVPNFLRAMEKSRVSRMAADLKTFEGAFLDFALTTGDFPPDSHLDPPYHLANGVGIENYVPVRAWIAETPFGGNYNWEGPDNYPYAGVSVSSTSIMDENLLEIDEVVDDGNLSTGQFRVPGNGRYTFIIEE